MDEQQWLTSTDPQATLDWLRKQGKLSERKARLFAATCCRRIWHLLSDDRCKRAVEVAELHADGHVDLHRLVPYYEAASVAAAGLLDETTAFAAARAAADAVRSYPSHVEGGMARAASAAAGAAAGAVQAEPPVQASLLRDIIRNPFRPSPSIAPSLLTSNDGLIKRLAEAAYQHRLLPSGQLDPERLAVLADALEEAGVDAELVEHLRGPGPHCRGCWALDHVLGKS